MIRRLLCKLGIHGPVVVTVYLMSQRVECLRCGDSWSDQAGL